MPMKNALQRAVEITGGQSALARAIGVKQAHVWYWLNRMQGKVTAEHVLAIESATGGQVTRSELRPDLYPPDEEASAASGQ